MRILNTLVGKDSDATRALELGAKEIEDSAQIFSRENFDVHTHRLSHPSPAGIND